MRVSKRFPLAVHSLWDIYRAVETNDEEHFVVNVHVEVSNQFIHWVMALGNGAQIIGPESVVEEVKTEIARLQEQYL